MDAELRERFDKSDRNQTEMLKLLHDHVTQSAVRDTQLQGQITANAVEISKHIEEHKERRGWWATLWGGMVLAVLASAWNFFAGRKA